MSDEVVFEQLKVGPMENFAYVFGDTGVGEAAIVDPGFEPDTLLEAAKRHGLTVTHVVLTHSHTDHVGALDEVVERTGARIVAHPQATADTKIVVDDGQELTIAGVPVTAHYTPGHCPDHVAYVVDDTYLISGDALFIGDCGRTDLPGSDVDAMHKTLMETIPSLPDHLEVYPGHDYGPEPHRSLATELAENFTLEERDLDAFKRFMSSD